MEVPKLTPNTALGKGGYWEVPFLDPSGGLGKDDEGIESL